MATNTSSTKPIAEAEEPKSDFDRQEVTRIFAKLRHEVNELVYDAGRKRLFFAKTKEEAVSKRNAALKVLDEFAERIDVLKKQE